MVHGLCVNETKLVKVKTKVTSSNTTNLRTWLKGRGAALEESEQGSNGGSFSKKQQQSLQTSKAYPVVSCCRFRTSEHRHLFIIIGNAQYLLLLAHQLYKDVAGNF
jgi:hypothetical protein